MNFFKINFLFDNDVFIVQKIKINLKKQIIKLKNCQNFQVSINIVIKKNFCLKRIVCIKIIIIMSTDVIINVFVIYYNQLSNDRDFLFEFQCRRHFDENDDVFVYIVDVNLNYVMIRNTIDLFVHLRNRDRLKTITKYNQQICYNFTSNVDFLIIDDYFNKKSIKL